MVCHGLCAWPAPTSKYLLVSVGITLASAGITGKAIWFNTRDLNVLLGQLGVSAKVTVLWNTGEWDSLIVGIPQRSTIFWILSCLRNEFVCNAYELGLCAHLTRYRCEVGGLVEYLNDIFKWLLHIVAVTYILILCTHVHGGGVVTM